MGEKFDQQMTVMFKPSQKSFIESDTCEERNKSAVLREMVNVYMKATQVLSFGEIAEVLEMATQAKRGSREAE